MKQIFQLFELLGQNFTIKIGDFLLIYCRILGVCYYQPLVTEDGRFVGFVTDGTVCISFPNYVKTLDSSNIDGFSNIKTLRKTAMIGIE